MPRGVRHTREIDDTLMKHRPDIDLDIIPLSHTTFGKLPRGIKIMWDNLAFIYAHTRMQEYKRSLLFT